MVFYPR